MTATAIQGPSYRISVLTPALLRLQWSPSGVFDDRPTQVVVDRAFAEVPVRVVEGERSVDLYTAALQLTYDRGPFSPQGLRVALSGGISTFHSVWRFGDPPDTLDGTVRTLDGADGRIPLERGILSRNGIAILDDSASLAMDDRGVPQPREPGLIDLYVFGYGRDYRAALRDYYRLTGRTPLIPRWALGNWWSRYHRYSDDEYRELIGEFARRRIPFSVAVLDMDWHWVDVPARFGSGWTGYSWNTDLFPDPPGFLAWLHDQGLRVTLNDHPADGVRAFETAYPSMARARGVDPASELPIDFDATDPGYLDDLFRCVLRPLEDEGVDFWWIDWQQGTNSRVPGLDPQWVLNDVHFRKAAEAGRRPMIFSRYAGPGSHRYPVGFSGDTIVSWASLAFQPEFTATAANIGYGWWSHDIGGHMFGIRDDELACRWVQLGVFSPINRLHATSNPFAGKEPWRYRPEVADLMAECLRLRHRLVPYLYSMAARATTEGLPLVAPLYHEHPWREPAYRHPNEFLFGTELLVAPVTTPRGARSLVAATPVWLPDGVWFDFFSGRRYAGGREFTAYRELDGMPVFAKAGAIVPLLGDEFPGNGTELPTSIEVRCFAGCDGEFVLIEDDGAPEAVMRWARTPIVFDWASRSVSIGPVQGDSGVVPAHRTWTVVLVGASGEPLAVELPDVPVTEAAVARWDPDVTVGLAANDVLAPVFSYLDRSQIEFEVKTRIYETVRDASSVSAAIAGLLALDVDDDVRGCVVEMLTAS